MPRQMTHVMTGVTFVLSCQARGVPTPKVTWSKNRHPILPGDPRVAVFASGYTKELTENGHHQFSSLLCWMYFLQVIYSSQGPRCRTQGTIGAQLSIQLVRIGFVLKWLSRVSIRTCHTIWGLT